MSSANLSVHFTRKFELCAIGSGEYHCSKEIDIEESRRCTLVWIKKGSGFFVAERNRFEINDKTVYCFSAGQLKKIVNEQQLEGYYFSIPPELLYITGSDFNFSLLPPRQTIVPGPVSIRMDEQTLYNTENILAMIRKESGMGISAGDELLKQLIKIFLIYLLQNVMKDDRSPKYTREFQLVKTFMDLLGQHITTRKMVSDYASELNITPGYLNLVVKKVSGFTASYHIQQQVVEEAKKRAMITDCSMKEIAYGLGFDDIAHFSKFFKNNSGTNFTNFKKAFCVV